MRSKMEAKVATSWKQKVWEKTRAEKGEQTGREKQSMVVQTWADAIGGPSWTVRSLPQNLLNNVQQKKHLVLGVISVVWNTNQGHN